MSDKILKKISLLGIMVLSITMFIPVVNAYNLSPENTIRLRVIANSNTLRDQAIKYRVREVVDQEIARISVDVGNVEEARTLLERRIPRIERRVNAVLKVNNIRYQAKLEYGENFFPRKTKDGVNFPAGHYESLVITLGRGRGQNWWCILFPPLCIMGTRDSDLVEYRSFFKDLFSRLRRWFFLIKDITKLT